MISRLGILLLILSSSVSDLNFVANRYIRLLPATVRRRLRHEQRFAYAVKLMSPEVFGEF